MKKSIIASIIALGMIGGAAHAADLDHQVIFQGSVSATTCDLIPTVDGVAMPSGIVYLGTVKPQTEGQAKEFALKADPNDASCAALTNQQTATIGWASKNFDTTGLKVDGTAADAKVLLSSVNAKTPGAITASSSISEFEANKVIGEGLKFSAKAKGGNDVGPFTTAASFSVAYK